ncbi:hypothetical protein [Brevibacterium casei]
MPVLGLGLAVTVVSSTAAMIGLSIILIIILAALQVSARRK